MDDISPDVARPPISRRGFLAGAAACVLCAAGGFAGGKASAGSQALTPTKVRTLTRAARLAAQPDGLFRVTTTEPVVALTFDDGPDPLYTRRVLDLLHAHDAHATFFLVGVNAATYRDLVAEELHAGHEIGNHTFDHPQLELLEPAQVRSEIDGGARAIVAAGAPAPKLFRPPKGYTDEIVGVIADADRYRTVFWDLAVEHFVDHAPVETGVNRLLERVGPGSIILAHDGGHVNAPGHPVIDRSRTMAALPLLLRGLRARGFDVVSVETLLERTSRAYTPKV